MSIILGARRLYCSMHGALEIRKKKRMLCNACAMCVLRIAANVQSMAHLSMCAHDARCIRSVLAWLLWWSLNHLLTYFRSVFNFDSIFLFVFFFLDCLVSAFGSTYSHTYSRLPMHGTPIDGIVAMRSYSDFWCSNLSICYVRSNEED